MNDNLNDFEKRFLECDTKFNTIFDLTSVATKVINSDLKIIKVNRAFSELLGYLPEEIEGRAILELACEEYKVHWQDLQKQLWTKKVPFFKLEACLHKKDGSLVWVGVTTILYKDQQNTYGFTVLEDISGLKKFEESQRRLNLALKYSGTAVWEIDFKTKAVFRSPDHDRIFGYEQRQRDWTLESYYQHILEQDLTAFKTAIDFSSSHSKIDLQLRLKNPDSVLKWVNFKGKFELNDKGEPSRIVGILNDITQDKLIERHKDDFISIASHELKTPVTGLKASLQMLDKIQDELSDRVKVLISQANKGINRISSIIDDLLNAGRNYQDQLALNKTSFNLYLLIQEYADQFSLSKSHHITIKGDDSLLVHADQERIGRVMTNILSNAIKYSPDSPDLEIIFIENEKAVKVSVVDQGPGIKAQIIPLLFDRYYQETRKNGLYSGLGLGLFISATIVRKHGGDIGVDSVVGEGSRFWFTIPK
jgi:PAS domain S-box-containing protein